MLSKEWLITWFVVEEKAQSGKQHKYSSSVWLGLEHLNQFFLNKWLLQMCQYSTGGSSVGLLQEENIFLSSHLISDAEE